MRKFVGTGLMLTALCTSAVGWAQTDYSSSDAGNTVNNAANNAAGTAGSDSGNRYSDTSNVSQAAPEQPVAGTALTREVVGLSPQVGMIGYQDPATGSGEARASYGITADINIANAVNPGMTNWFIGPTIGAIYSHLGNPGNGFFGSGTGDPVGFDGANLLLLPTDLKVGYNVTDWFRLSAHGGANVMYKSIASSLFTGTTSTGTGSQWSYYPNVGADLEFAAGKNVAIGLRPDVLLTPENDVFVGTLQFTFPLG